MKTIHCLIKHHGMRMEVQLNAFLTSALDGSGQLHAPAALTPSKSPRYPLDRKLGGPQSRSGSGGEKYPIIVPVGNRTQIIQSVP
jgi:hypothetical protein